MSSSRSRSDQTTNFETTQTSENLNIQDVEGITIANESGEVSIVQTDHNAIGSATRLAEGSLAAGRAQVESGNKLAAQLFAGATGAVLESGERAFDFASDESSRAALAVDRSQERSFDFAGDALSFVGGAVQKTQETIGAAVGAILQIGKEQNTSTDQRVADIAASSQKNVVVLVGIVGVALVAMMIFGRK